jgi:hypothetical protein
MLGHDYRGSGILAPVRGKSSKAGNIEIYSPALDATEMRFTICGRRVTPQVECMAGYKVRLAIEAVWR